MTSKQDIDSILLDPEYNKNITKKYNMKRNILFLLMCLLSTTSWSETFLIDVGVEQFIPAPEVPYGYIDKAIWDCDYSKVTFVEKGNSGAIIKISSYFDNAATVSLTYVVKYYDYKGFTRSYTGIKYYSVQCKGTAPMIVPSGITLKKGETFQLHISPSSYESQAVWSDWTGSIATKVNSSGVVKANNVGTGIVFATIPNLSDPLTCLVYVKDTKLTLSSNVASDTIERGTEVKLTANKSTAKIYYTLDNSSPEMNGELYTSPISITEDVTLKAIAYDDDYEPSDMLTKKYTVVDPKIVLSSNVSSGTVNVGTEVILSSNVPDATIYYTTDESSPTLNSDIYQEPIIIEDNTIIKAFAVCENYRNSDVLTLKYSVRSVTLSISPADSELLPAGTEITLTANPADAKIYYTTDGSEPTKASILYYGPIVAEQSFSLRAKAYYDGYKESEEIVQQYEITSLAATNFFPEQNGRTLNRHTIPSVTFNGDIREGDNFNNIQLLKGNDIIEGTPIIVDDILYFVPNSDELEIGSYTFSIPEKSIICNGNNNLETQQSFSVCQTVKPMVAVGNGHSLLLKSDGSLWAWGNNSVGQLGNGKNGNNVYNLTPEMIMDDVIYIDAADNYSVAIKSDGSLWSWGGNSSGQLGDGTTTKSDTPIKILDNVTKVSCGYNFCTAILKDGSLWTWGSNSYKQLGNGNTTSSYKPQKIMDDVVMVSASKNNLFCLAIKGDKSLWSWGRNYEGQLGNGSTDIYSSPRRIMENVVYCSTGNVNCVAIKEDGTRWQWGENILSNEKFISSSSPIEMTEDFEYAVINKDLGCYTNTNSFYIIKQDKSLWGYDNLAYGNNGDSSYLQCIKKPIKILDNVISLSASSTHRVAITDDGSVWSWGYNDYGQLCNGSSEGGKSIVPTKITGIPDEVVDASLGINRSLILNEDGGLWMWGTNDNGGLGFGYNQIFNPQKILDNVSSVVSGSYHNLVIKDDKSLWAWGFNSKGQIGDGTTKGKSNPIKILDNVSYVAAGFYNSFAIKDDKSLWAWGYNNLGQLGDGTTTNRTTPIKIIDGVKKVSSSSHTLAIKTDGTLWAWGYNKNGQIGNGSSSSSSYQLNPTKVLSDIVDAVACDNYSMAIKSDRTLWCWGVNERGNLGDGTKTSRLRPVQVMEDVIGIAGASPYSGCYTSFAIKTDGSLWAWGGNSGGIIGDSTYTDRLQPVQIAEDVKSIKAYSQRVIAIKNDGTALTWGINSDHSLFPVTTLKPQQINMIRSHEDPAVITGLTTNILEITVGDRTLINAIEPHGAEYESMVWSTSDETIATVSSRGIVTGVAPGESTLTVKVTSKEGTEFTAQCIVTVTEDIEPKYPATGAYIAKADYSLEGGTSHAQEEWTVTLTKDDAEDGKYWIEGIISQSIIDWSNTRTTHEGVINPEDIIKNTGVSTNIGFATDKVYGYLQKDGNIVIPSHQYVRGYVNRYYTKNYSSGGDITLNISYDDSTMSIADAWGLTKVNDLIEDDEETEYVRFENMTFRMKTEEEPILKGDVNGDGEVNVTDIVEIVNYIMEKPSDRFVAAAADLNGDGEINVTDIVKVVTIIMDTNSSSAPMRRSAMSGNLTLSGNGQTKTAIVQHAEQFTAAQFDIILGDGQEIDNISLNSNSDHSLTWKMTKEGICRVVVYSLTNSVFDVNDSELMSISLKGMNGRIAVENVILVTANSNTTGIGIMTTDKSVESWYTLDGRKLDSQPTKKGVYIKNGKKIVVR